MCVSDEGIAIKPTQASDVATVSLSDSRNQPRNVGVMRMPPPTPRKPESTPAPSPITVHGIIAVARGSVRVPVTVPPALEADSLGAASAGAARRRDTKIAV